MPDERRSLASLVATQHRLIETFARGAGTALAEGDATAAAGRLGRLRHALEAHFTLEEQHYFPRAEGARPELAAEIGALREEHVQMREGLDKVSAQITSGAIAEASRELASFRVAFEAHEVRERAAFASPGSVSTGARR